MAGTAAVEVVGGAEIIDVVAAGKRPYTVRCVRLREMDQFRYLSWFHRLAATQVSGGIQLAGHRLSTRS